jgi:hypothetical protein
MAIPIRLVYLNQAPSQEPMQLMAENLPLMIQEDQFSWKP